MSGSPSLRPRRSRRPPKKYSDGVWVSPAQGGNQSSASGRVIVPDLPDLVASSDDDSDDEYVPSSCAQTSRVAPGGPPPPRVSGPAFSPLPMNVTPIIPFNNSPSPPTVRDQQASLNSPGWLGRDEVESEENISTATVDDDSDSLHLALTPTQDIQGQPGISSPPFFS